MRTYNQTEYPEYCGNHTHTHTQNHIPDDLIILNENMGITSNTETKLEYAIFPLHVVILELTLKIRKC